MPNFTTEQRAFLEMAIAIDKTVPKVVRNFFGFTCNCPRDDKRIVAEMETSGYLTGSIEQAHG